MAFGDPTPLIDGLQKIPASTWVTAGGASFVAFLAGLAFARGVVKQLLGMASLAASVAVAWYVFSNRGQVFGTMGANLSTDRLMMFSAAAGLLTYFVCKGAIHFLAGFGLLQLLGGLNGWKGLFISLLPSGFLLWVGTMVLRLVGNVYGMESAATLAREGTRVQGQLTSWVHQLSQQVDRSTIGSLAEKLDPFDMRATANLARLLILWPEGSVWQRLASSSPRTSAALHHPKMQQLGYDPQVRAAIQRQDFAGLMQLPQVEKVAEDPELRPVLSGLALEEAMDAIVYKRPQPVRLR